MISFKNLKTIFALILSSIILISCNGKLPGADARKYPEDPKLRVKKNTVFKFLKEIIIK